MKKKLIFMFIGVFVILIGISSVNALLCKNSAGYYSQCDYGSYGPRYYVHYDYSRQKISHSYKRIYNKGYRHGYYDGYNYRHNYGYYQRSRGYSGYYNNQVIRLGLPNLHIRVKYRPRRIIIRSYYR